MDNAFDLVERDRGILTERDREILVSSFEIEDLTANAKNQRRYNIRNRVRNAIYDFEILARYLPHEDYRQLFEPVYEWSRERHHLDEAGRHNTWPDFTEYLQGCLSMIEFLTYGIHAGGKPQTGELLRLLVQEGVERGTWNIQHTQRGVISDVNASFVVETDNDQLWQNYIQQVESRLPSNPSEAAEEILRLNQRRRIPPDIARQWIQRYVQRPNYGRNLEG